MLLQKSPIGYYEDGMVTMLLFNGVGKIPKSYREVDRQEIQRLLEFPNTTQLHIYNITNQNYDSVLGLIRFIKSLYKIPIFCYYDK